MESLISGLNINKNGIKDFNNNNINTTNYFKMNNDANINTNISIPFSTHNSMNINHNQMNNNNEVSKSQNQKIAFQLYE